MSEFLYFQSAFLIQPRNICAAKNRNSLVSVVNNVVQHRIETYRSIEQVIRCSCSRIGPNKKIKEKDKSAAPTEWWDITNHRISRCMCSRSRLTANMCAKSFRWKMSSIHWIDAFPIRSSKKKNTLQSVVNLRNGILSKNKKNCISSGHYIITSLRIAHSYRLSR